MAINMDPNALTDSFSCSRVENIRFIWWVKGFAVVAWIGYSAYNITLLHSISAHLSSVKDCTVT